MKRTVNRATYIRVMILVVAVIPFAVTRGEYPEPMPAYAMARALRVDASLHAVAFFHRGAISADSAVGIACGDRGTILLSEDGGRTWQLRESGVDCRLDDVVWVNRQRVVVVGGSYDRITRISRGVVLYSNDGGKSWQRAADDEIPRLRRVRLLEDQSLEAVGDLSHSLLTRRLESRDAGHSWHGDTSDQSRARVPRRPTSQEFHRWVGATGIPAPIRDACRIGGDVLCAVGDHGLVLLSRDRGKSWKEVRGERRRAAVLMVSRDPSTVAWSLLGSEALESRNRVALLLSKASDGATAVDVAHQAAVMLGGSAADIVVDEASADNEAARWIAIHRPSVVLLDHALPSPVHDAFFQAATASGVARIIDYSFDRGRGTTRHQSALLPRSGILASDLASDALHYVAPQQRVSPSLSLRTLYDLAPSARRGDSVTGGLPLRDGQRLAANLRQASRRQTQILQGRLNQSARMTRMIGTSSSARDFQQSLARTLDQTAREDQFRLAWSMLLETWSGENETAAAFHESALEEIAARFPSFSAGRWARLRLDSLRHGVEWDRLKTTRANTAAPDSKPSTTTVPVSPFQVPTGNVQQVSAVSPLVVPIPETHRLQTAKTNTNENEVDLAWEFHPLVLISREAARRRGDDGQLQLTDGESADLRRLTDSSESDWSRLLASAGPRVIVARRAARPPKLDGILDDPCWQSAIRRAGRSPHAHISFDDDFVYVAVSCAADLLGPDAIDSTNSSNPRDHDLRDVDRLQLSFDTDRDLMTSMQLRVSRSGRTHDSIGGHPAWQPTWYVAIDSAGDDVAIEMAIMRRDLVELPVTAGESWFISAKTIRAGQSASPPIVPDPGDWWRVVFRP